MSGNRFLLSLREVSNSEKIFESQYPTKAKYEFGNEDGNINDNIIALVTEVDQEIDDMTTEVQYPNWTRIINKQQLQSQATLQKSLLN